MLAGSGSARIAAERRARSVAASSASGSFHGTTTVVPAAAPAGTPGLDGQRLRGQARAGLREQPVDVAVVGAGELDDPLAAGRRAREAHAVIVASVPEEVMRSISTLGIRARDLLGELDLAGRGRAEARAPRPPPRSTAASTSGWAWPWISGPHEQT